MLTATFGFRVKNKPIVAWVSKRSANLPRCSRIAGLLAAYCYIRINLLTRTLLRLSARNSSSSSQMSGPTTFDSVQWLPNSVRLWVSVGAAALFGYNVFTRGRLRPVEFVRDEFELSVPDRFHAFLKCVHID